MVKRSGAGHAAAALRAGLQARLAAGRGDGSARGDRLCRAIALCDMFLRARADSEEALEVLKQEVQLTLQEAPGGRGGARGARTEGSRGRAGGREGGASRGLGSSQEQNMREARGGGAGAVGAAEAPGLWTLPVGRIEMYAGHARRQNEYSAIAKLADQQATKALEQKRLKKVREQQLCRQALEAQIAEKRRERVLERKEKFKEGKQIMRRVEEYYVEEEARSREVFAKAVQAKEDRALQVKESKLRLRNQKAVQLMEEQEQVRRLEEAHRLEVEEKRKKVLERALMMKKVQEENMVELARRREEKERERERDVEIAQENERRAEARAAQREADIKALQEKILAKYRAGGGESMAESLKKKEEELEANILKVQKEYDRKMRAEDLRKQQKRQADQAEMDRAIQEQLRIKEDRRQAEVEERRLYALHCQKEQREHEEQLKAAKASRKEKKAKQLAGIISQMKHMTELRVQHASDQMPLKVRQMNSSILDSSKLPFLLG